MKSVYLVSCVVSFVFALGCATTKMVYKKDGVTVKVWQPVESKTPSVVYIDEKGAVEYTAPVSFSPVEIAEAANTTENAKAKAKAFLWYHETAIAFFAVGSFLLWKGHLSAGLSALAGAPSVLVLGHFGRSDKALLLCMVLGGMILAFVSAWYLLKWRGFIDPRET